MSMQATLPTPSRGNPGKFKNNMLAQRKRRNDFAEMCFASLKDVHAFWVSVLQDTNRPFHERMQAADCLVRRAVGEVSKAPLEDCEAALNVGNTHYTFQWLPPDPADHSKVIEPC